MDTSIADTLTYAGHLPSGDKAHSKGYQTLRGHMQEMRQADVVVTVTVYRTAIGKNNTRKGVRYAKSAYL